MYVCNIQMYINSSPTENKTLDYNGIFWNNPYTNILFAKKKKYF